MNTLRKPVRIKASGPLCGVNQMRKVWFQSLPLQDFNFTGTRILSCGMDHALKLWEVDTPPIQKAIQESYEYQRGSKKWVNEWDVTAGVIESFLLRRSFNTMSVHFPSFSTRDIHRNYVDCVKWFGQLALSKSCENCVVLWKPPQKGEHTNTPTILHK